jgi:LPXTG-site transpeptidase (sortase) family protein
MNIKMLQRAIAFVLLLSLFICGVPVHAAIPTASVNNALKPLSADISHLEIPSINLSVPIVVAHFVGNTWDFSKLTDDAGFFEGLPVPGKGGNAIIGAHSELDHRIPGPFYNLDHVKVTDQISVTKGGVKYTYIVTKTWYVRPTDVSPISPTKTATLTLLTCAGYNQGVYTMRLVVRAQLVS